MSDKDNKQLKERLIDLIIGFVSSILGGLFLLFILEIPQKIDNIQSTVTGFSTEWGSGWIDLSSPRNFNKCDKLHLKVGGTARKIRVRLLPKEVSPDLAKEVLPDVYDVPFPSRLVEVVLPEDYPSIVQISVHGGPNPWGRFPLVDDNGPATLESYKLVARSEHDCQ